MENQLIDRYFRLAPVKRRLIAATFVTTLCCGLAYSELPHSAKADADGMTMAQPAPQMQKVLTALGSLGGKPIETLTPKEARLQPTPADAVKVVLKQEGMSTAPQPVGSVADMKIPGPEGLIPIRVYTPAGSGPFPVLVYFHGGGWVIAGINTYDSSARALADAAGYVVISVAYRQAPENKFPAAADDAYASMRWAMTNAAKINGKPSVIAVAGESAGGNLATVVCMMARDKHQRMPIYQLLVYPVTNHAFNTASYEENAHAKPLNRAMMKWFWNNYLPSPTDGDNPYASPLRAKTLAGLPPATIIAAQIDPLRTEGRQYADRLRDAGVKVHYREFYGVTHEFFGMGAVVPQAKTAVQTAAADLQRAAQGRR